MWRQVHDFLDICCVIGSKLYSDFIDLYSAFRGGGGEGNEKCCLDRLPIDTCGADPAGLPSFPKESSYHGTYLQWLAVDKKDDTSNGMLKIKLTKSC